MPELDMEAELMKEIQEELDRSIIRELSQRQFDKEHFSIADKKSSVLRCYHECPYFDLEGSPSPVMTCTHPEAESPYIISHPACDEGFPSKCPLWVKEN